LSGLLVHADSVSNRGIQPEFTAQLKTVIDEIRVIENNRKVFKAEQMEQTARLKEKLAELQRLCSEARKVVKLEFPKESWRAFGIIDQH
jgi:hypothetical protein